MGGYGGASGRNKGKDGCYYDSGNHKVNDPNAIAVAEYYMNLGMYVVFLQEKPGEGGRPDLLIDYDKGGNYIKANQTRVKTTF